jgi:hypothetical protein
MTYPKWPSEFQLRRKNRAVLAVRQHWPEGALQACQDLEEQHPGWYVSWRGENTTPGFERPAGFYATYDHGLHKTEVFSPTLEAVESLLVDVPEHDFSVRGCEWCRARL